MSDRRYSDEEVAAIFASAIEAETPAFEQPSRENGLTLRELQDIGRDVGITDMAIARAAGLVDTGAPAAPRMLMGFPIAVERTVVLNRRLTDAEWELLVVKLRDAFDARGRVSAHGSFRQWTNGNLQALLEPTTTGHRLRLRTVKQSARTFIGMGAMMVGFGVATSVATALTGHVTSAAPGIALLYAAGIAMFAAGVMPLRAWARTRGRQMEAIAEGLRQG